MDFDIFISQKLIITADYYGVFEKVGLIVWGPKNIA